MHVSYPCGHNMILIMVDCNVFIALEIFRQWITKTNTQKCKRPTFFNLPSELETTVFLYINQLSFGQSIYPTFSSRFHPTDSLQSNKILRDKNASSNGDQPRTVLSPGPYWETISPAPSYTLQRYLLSTKTFNQQISIPGAGLFQSRYWIWQLSRPAQTVL